MAYLPGADLVYVASGGDGTLRRYAGADLGPAGVTKLGDDADNVRLDPRGGRVAVGYPYSCGCTSMSRRPQQQA